MCTCVDVFKVLADETRLKILTMLAKENLCSCQLHDEFDLSQATLSYHMKQLLECGLVLRRQDGYWTRYSLNKTSFSSVLELLNDLVKEQKVDTPPIQCQSTK